MTMARNINSDLYVDKFYNAYRDGWLVPQRFCPGAVTRTINFMIRTQKGGPFEVTAERDDRFPRYYFTGPQWISFIDQNNIMNGDCIVFSSTGPFTLDAIVLAGNLIRGRVNEQPPNVFDWLVMVRPRTHIIPSHIHYDAVESEGSQTLVPALWDLKLTEKSRWIFAVDEDFARKARLVERGNVALMTSANSAVIMATFERVGGNCYCTEGLTALIESLNLDIGDKLTFISGLNQDGSIYVNVSRGKIPLNRSNHWRMQKASPSQVRHSRCGRQQCLLTADKNAFSITYNVSFFDFIPLPRMFFTNANIKVGDEIIVRQPGDGIWKVQMNVDSAGNYGLHSGWREFVERNHLHENDIITFKIPPRLTRVKMQVEVVRSN